MRREKAVAECKAKDDAINAMFAQYLAKEHEKDILKQRKHDDARRAKSNRDIIFI